jgi:serine/threonine-protein kinase PknK
MPLLKKHQAVPGAPGGDDGIPGYHDLQRIGRGGFSVVYRARQDQLDRVVALKVLSVEFVDGQVRRRFVREVQLTSRLTGHPNVVTVLDSGLTSSGRPYIAMEYFERGSLRDRLVAEGPLPVAEVLRIGVKMAGALAAAHQEGVLHRDIKPQNILVSRYGEPALADFGTARLTDALDVSARTEALTPYHAAPEILQGANPSVACDVYSLGSTLYQLLSGRPPYQSEDGGIAALLLRVLREDPPPITRVDVPPSVGEALRRAMAKSAEQRYPDAAEFAYALQRLQVELRLPVTELTDAPSLPAGIAAPGPPAPVPPAPVSPGPVSRVPVSSAPVGPLGVPAHDQAPVPIPIDLPDAGDAAGGTLDYTTRDRTTRHTGIRLPDAATPGLDAAPGGRPTTRSRAGRRLPVLVGVVVLVALAAGTPLLFHRRSHAVPTGTASAGGGATSATVPAAGAAPSPIDTAALAPSNLAVTVEGGSSVVLAWRLPAAAAPYTLLVRTIPTESGAQEDILAPGRTTTTVTGLNPATGYCFQVGPVVSVGARGPSVAWSKPACIRGAAPAS